MQSIAAARGGTGRLSPEALAYAGLTLSTFGWASAFIAGKVVLAEITPLPAAAARYAVAALLLLPFAMRQRPTLRDLSNAASPLLTMVLAGGVLYPWLFLVALSRTTATNTALLVALNPVLTLLLSPLAGERLHARHVGGVTLALTGAALVITVGKWEDIAHLAALALNFGDLLAVAAALCWAVFNLASRRVVVHLTASFTNCAIYGAGSLAFFFLAWPERTCAQLTAASAAALVCLLSMAVLSSVMAGQLFLFGVRTVGVHRTVVFVYLVPVLTALASVLLLHEAFTVAQGLGGAGVLAGVYWTARGSAS
jgi:drug/metabolite transporter (DMT)-like permease